MARWRPQLGLTDDSVLGIGIDRIDYTKGIPERLRALDRFLEKHPDVSRAAACSSRSACRAGRTFRSTRRLTTRSTAWSKRSTGSGAPSPGGRSSTSSSNIAPVEMMALHRLADFCIVSSLDDGMNLVAKEFVASRIDDDGVLDPEPVHRRGPGTDACPLGQSLCGRRGRRGDASALTMPDEERRKRMQKMRASVAENNIYRWAGKVPVRPAQVRIPGERRKRHSGAGPTMSRFLFDHLEN